MFKFRSADVDEYVAWLKAYVVRKGPITHAYDYPFDNVGFLIAQEDFTIDGECGSSSAKILVPEGVKCLGGELGHNTLYFEATSSTLGDFVPVYSDPEFDDIPGVAEARKKAAAEHRQFLAMTSRSPHYDSDLTDYVEQPQREGEPLKGPHVVHTDEPVTVNVQDGHVVLLPRQIPTTLTPDEAEALAYRILAAANRLPEQERDTTPDDRFDEKGTLIRCVCGGELELTVCKVANMWGLTKRCPKCAREYS